MNESEAMKIILDGIAVTPQRVVVAKAIILNAFQKTASSEHLKDAVLEANHVVIPRQVAIHPSVDPLPALLAATDALSWSLAASEAIWSLIHGGYLIPIADLIWRAPSIGWTSGGSSSRWHFEDLTIPLPN